MAKSVSDEALGLGIDAGGTQTRWALATSSGEIVATGHVDGLTALLMGNAAGRERIGKTLAELASAVLRTGRPTRVVGGMTGYDGTEGEGEGSLAAIIAAPLGLEPKAVDLSNDVEIAYKDLFAPGEGYLVYAGTGSIAIFLHADGQAHRLGGHGGILDDGGSGYWIAVRALRHVWREEDERPGCSSESPLARELFARIGGSAWSDSRQFVYGAGFEASRGKMGRLALAVAAAANAGDPVAQGILEDAGRELGRLANVMLARFGPRPLALAGRVVELHPLIEKAMRSVIPLRTPLTVRSSEAHVAAARIAARSAS